MPTACQPQVRTGRRWSGQGPRPSAGLQRPGLRATSPLRMLLLSLEGQPTSMLTSTCTVCHPLHFTEQHPGVVRLAGTRGNHFQALLSSPPAVPDTGQPSQVQK